MPWVKRAGRSEKLDYADIRFNLKTTLLVRSKKYTAWMQLRRVQWAAAKISRPVRHSLFGMHLFTQN